MVLLLRYARYFQINIVKPLFNGFVRQTLVEIDFPGTFIHREEVGVTLNYSKTCVDIDI